MIERDIKSITMKLTKLFPIRARKFIRLNYAQQFMKCLSKKKKVEYVYNY